MNLEECIVHCEEIETRVYFPSDVFPRWTAHLSSFMFRRELKDAFPLKHPEWLESGDTVLLLRMMHLGRVWGMGVLHASKSGKYNGIEYSPLAKRSLVREVVQKQIGDDVYPFERCNDLVGLTFYQFNSREDRDAVMCDMIHSMGVMLL